MEVVLLKNHTPLFRGKQEKVREMLELMVAERLGLSLELQESTEDGEFQVSLHTDTFECLSSRDIRQLAAMKITDDPELATEGFKRLLNVDFQVVDTKIA